MRRQNDHFPSEQQLERLESRVELLVEACTQLRRENLSLRRRQEELVAERAQLVEKNDLARSRVEAMITRLRAMEQGG